MAAIFGEMTLLPRGSAQAPVLAQYVAAISSRNAGLRAGHGVPTLVEELAHLLSTIESYFEDIAPGAVTRRDWVALILNDAAYAEFEVLRREVDRAVHAIQLDRRVHYPWLGRDPEVRSILWHLVEHTNHHRGRLAVLMRLCGEKPPSL